jgi:hypothetical protein
MIDIYQSTIVERYRQLSKAMDNIASIRDQNSLLEYIATASAMLAEAEMAWLLFPDLTNRTLTSKVTCFNKDLPQTSLTTHLDVYHDNHHQRPVILNDPALYDQAKGRLSHS